MPLKSLIIRDATVADLPAIVAMLADDALGSVREDASIPLDEGYLRAFEAIDSDPNQQLVIAALDGAIIGTLQLSFLPGLSYRGAWRGQIEAVRIARGLRGQGLGARFIGWAVERCRARGCHLVQLTSNSVRIDAHRFYERLGFARSHAGFKLTLDGVSS
ncbi:GNAT family N-acetyltransferase [Sphingobium nicotianae]|uniref:GNAT family N-acetyltransferase n=1 Tax=Sphingobium nicotianae TaxID=2782607 RepID=A0A9X1IS89_9SPHN|nr:GNAT family N-acetyltransferase [Sphingobium nicotianae]MBT2188172.1 GNAT family N-acetyltransferase [Sphingobium nicotianae]